EDGHAAAGADAGVVGHRRVVVAVAAEAAAAPGVHLDAGAGDPRGQADLDVAVERVERVGEPALRRAAPAPAARAAPAAPAARHGHAGGTDGEAPGRHHPAGRVDDGGAPRRATVRAYGPDADD